MSFSEFVKANVVSGRIEEINNVAVAFFGTNIINLPAAVKADILCSVMCIAVHDLDEVIAKHSEVSRTVKGHGFEVAFDSLMAYNNVVVDDVGGDSDIDRKINGKTLQLKTPFVNGCNYETQVFSYKTHKTHGAKSQQESFDYYHKVEDFADYLVGLVSYNPFKVLIVPKANLPRVREHDDYIESPMYLPTVESEWINNFAQLGVTEEITIPENFFDLEENECLPLSSNMLELKSDYILRAIFLKENFRIWDMNMRGFIREHILHKTLTRNHIKVYPSSVTGLPRSDKCDLVLKKNDNRFVRFQVKGLTWNGCKLKGFNTMIDCETQLSRGRVNDHPTQSRLYRTDDFEGLIIAIDPPYTNKLTLETFNRPDYNWSFFAIPTRLLRTHPNYPNRVFSHQYIYFRELQEYRVGADWFDSWLQEL